MEEAIDPDRDVDQLTFREMTSDFAEEVSEGGTGTSSVQKLAKSWIEIVETLNFVSKCKSKGKGKKGQRTSTGGQWQGTSQRVWRATASRGRSQRKQEGALKTPRKWQGQRQEWRKGQRQAKTPHTPRVRRDWGTPRVCAPVKDGLTTPQKDPPEGEDTNEDRYWTEEDGETLQLGYLGQRFLFDEFRHWDCVTVVTHKSRNCQQCSRRRGCLDKRGTVVGSLWDNDNDMVLMQLADDRTKKGMVKISAVVDSGAEANALPEKMMQWIPLKPSSA